MNWALRLGLIRFLAADTSSAAGPVRVMGLAFPHPVGLAAGLDKNGDYIDALAALGFAAIEIGTLTPRPQPGNPKPRMFRLQREQAIINRMGFNNKGIDHALARLAASRFDGIVGINIGKNFDTPVENAIEDYLICLRKCYSAASYVTINLSSPNTPGLRSLQFGEELAALLQAVMAQRDELASEQGRRVPIAVKIAPDLSDEELKDICAALLKHGVDGVIATNTTVDRDSIVNSQYRNEAGGLSGKPLTDKSTRILRKLREELADRIPVIAVGGIMTASDAASKFSAGADMVQLYSGFIYAGPALIEDILKEGIRPNSSEDC